MSCENIQVETYPEKSINSVNYIHGYFDNNQVKEDKDMKGAISVKSRIGYYQEYVEKFEEFFRVDVKFELSEDNFDDYFNVVLSDSVTIDLKSVGKYLLERLVTNSNSHLEVKEGLLMEVKGEPSSTLIIDNINIIRGISKLLCMSSAADPNTRDKSYVMHQVLHIMYATTYDYAVRPESSIRDFTGAPLTPDLQGFVETLYLNGNALNNVLLFTDFKNTDDSKKYFETLYKYYYPGLTAMYASNGQIENVVVNIVDITPILVEDAIDTALVSSPEKIGVYYALYIAIKYFQTYWSMLPNVDLKNTNTRFIPTTINLPTLGTESIIKINEDMMIDNFLYGLYRNELSSCYIPLSKEKLDEIKNGIKNRNLNISYIKNLCKNINIGKRSVDVDKDVESIQKLGKAMQLDNIDELVYKYKITGSCNVGGVSFTMSKRINDTYNMTEIYDTLSENLLRLTGNFISVEVNYKINKYDPDTIEDVSLMVKTILEGNLTTEDIRNIQLNKVKNGKEIFSNPIKSAVGILELYTKLEQAIRTSDTVNDIAPSFAPFIDTDGSNGIKELGINVLYETDSKFGMTLKKLETLFRLLDEDTRIAAHDTREKIFTTKLTHKIGEILFRVDKILSNMKDVSIDPSDQYKHIKDIISKVQLGIIEDQDLKDLIKELDQGKEINTYYWKRVYEILGIELPHYIAVRKDSESDYLCELAHIVCHQGKVCKFCGNSTTQTKIKTLTQQLNKFNGMSVEAIKDVLRRTLRSDGDCELYNKIERIILIRQKHKAIKGHGEIVGLLEEIAFKMHILIETKFDLDYVESENNKNFLKNYLNGYVTDIEKSCATGEVYERSNEYYKCIDSKELREIFNIGNGNYKTTYTHETPKNVIIGYDMVDDFLNLIRKIPDDRFEYYLKNVLKLYNNVIMDAARIGKRLNCYVRKSFKDSVYFMTYNTDGYKLVITYDSNYIMKYFGLTKPEEIVLLFGQALVTEKTVTIRYNLTDTDIYSVERAMSYYSIWKEHERYMNIPAEESMYKFISVISLKNRFNTCTLMKLLRYFLPNITQDKNNVYLLFLDKMLDGDGNLSFYSYDMVTTTLFKLYKVYCEKILEKYVFRQDKSILYGIYNLAQTNEKDIIMNVINLNEWDRNKVLYDCHPRSQEVEVLENPLKQYNKSDYKAPTEYTDIISGYLANHTIENCLEFSDDSIKNIQVYFFNPKYQINNPRIFTDMCMLYHLQYGGSQNYKVASRELIDKVVDFDKIYIRERNKKENYCSIRGLNNILNNYATKHGYQNWHTYYKMDPVGLYREFYDDFEVYEPDGPSKVMKIDPFAMILFTKYHCNKYNISKFDSSKMNSDMFSIIKNKALSNFDVDEFYKANTIDFNEFVVNNPYEYFNPDRDYLKYVHIPNLDVNKKYSDRIVYYEKEDVNNMGKDKILIQKLSNFKNDRYEMSMENFHKLAWLSKRKGKKLRLNNMMHILILHMLDDIFKSTGFYKLGHEKLTTDEITNLLLYSGYDISNNGLDLSDEILEDIEAAIIERNLTYYQVIDKFGSHKFVFSVAFKDETGGNREFYIANLPARLCVNLLDKAFVQFCEKSQNEYISVPGNTKIDSISHIVQSVNKKDNKKHTTVYASCDCSKWSNKAFMLEYKTILVTMGVLGIFTLDDTNLFFNIMTKMEFKWIEIPALYVENKMTTTENFIYYAGKYFLEIFGSWLQGQINFLSSFKHSICATMIAYILESTSGDSKLYSFVHSDDSAYIFYSENPEGKARDVLGKWLINTIHNCYNCFNQCINDKKTSTGGFMEFCSVFYTPESANAGLSRLVRMEYNPTLGDPFSDMISYFSKVRVWRYQDVPYNYLYELLKWMKFIWCELTPYYGLTTFALNPTVYSVADIIYSDMMTIVKPISKINDMGFDSNRYYSEMLTILKDSESSKISDRMFPVPRVESTYDPPTPKSPLNIRKELESYKTLTTHILGKVSNIPDITYLHDKYPEFDVLDIPMRIPAFKTLGIIDIYHNHNFLMTFSNFKANQIHVERFKIVSNLYYKGEFYRKYINDIKTTTYENDEAVWNELNKLSNSPIKDQYKVTSTNIAYAENLLSSNYVLEDNVSEIFQTVTLPNNIRSKLKYYDPYAIIYANDLRMYRKVLRKEIESGILPSLPAKHYIDILHDLGGIDSSSLENFRNSKLKLCSILEIGTDKNKTGMVRSDMRDMKKFPIDLGHYIYLTDVDTTSYSLMVTNYVLSVIRQNKSTHLRYNLDKSVVLVDGRSVSNSIDLSSISNGLTKEILYANRRLDIDKAEKLDTLLKSTPYMNPTYILGFRDYKMVNSLGDRAKYYLREDKTLDDFSLITFGIDNLAAAFETSLSYLKQHMFVNRNDCGHPISIFPLLGQKESKRREFIYSTLQSYFLTNITWEKPRIFKKMNYIRNKDKRELCMKLYGHFVVITDELIIKVLNPYQIMIGLRNSWSIMTYEPLFTDANITLCKSYEFYDPDQLIRRNIYTTKLVTDESLLSQGVNLKNSWNAEREYQFSTEEIYKSDSIEYVVHKTLTDTTKDLRLLSEPFKYTGLFSDDFRITNIKKLYNIFQQFLKYNHFTWSDILNTLMENGKTSYKKACDKIVENAVENNEEFDFMFADEDEVNNLSNFVINSLQSFVGDLPTYNNEEEFLSKYISHMVSEIWQEVEEIMIWRPSDCAYIMDNNFDSILELLTTPTWFEGKPTFPANNEYLGKVICLEYNAEYGIAVLDVTKEYNSITSTYENKQAKAYKNRGKANPKLSAELKKMQPYYKLMTYTMTTSDILTCNVFKRETYQTEIDKYYTRIKTIILNEENQN